MCIKACVVFLGILSARGFGLSVGRYLETRGGHMLIVNSSPTVMSNCSKNENLFAGLTNGDKILVVHDGVNASYPGQTGAYFCYKLKDDGIGAISEEMIISSVRENYLEIAKKAVAMIQNNDVIYIPSATVGLFMAQNISASFGLSIQKTQAISFWDALINSAKTIVGLYPKEKIGFDSIVSICPANRLDILITDWDASEEDLKKFAEQEIKVIVVDKSE